MKDTTDTGNLDLWNRFADIDPKFTKAITGKPYKGTSPNPQYVMRCLTEMFGPVGEGFGWVVLAEGFQPLGDEILHWCRIRFWHSSPENGYESYGQTKALMNTRNGQMSDEDAPKKSLTDAIVKAASHVGIASNIFLGRWDDQKYVAEVNADYRAAEKTGGGDQFNAGAVRDRIKGKIGKAESLDELINVWKTEADDIAALKDKAPPMFAEITKAKDDRKSALSTDLGGDEIPY